MKQTIKTSRTAGYLEKMFRELNDHYFNSEIEEPIITIQSTPRAYGHVTVSKAWHKSNGDQRHELTLTQAHLTDRLKTLPQPCCMKWFISTSCKTM